VALRRLGLGIRVLAHVPVISRDTMSRRTCCEKEVRPPSS
jgi:hypothetical protein